MRIVVTGREGQLVQSLIERGAERGQEILALGRPDLDLAGDPEAIEAAIAYARPDAVISAAAYTAVDKAESERETAFAVNERGAAAVARAAAALGVPLIHLSTDYVFSGSKPAPYREEDPTDPAGVYGQSKLAGEAAVLAEHPDSAVLRTAWVYSPFGSNFVKTMLRLADNRDEVGVVADQRGNPTSAIDLADSIMTIADNLASGRGGGGVFHLAGTGDASWAEFAETVFAASRRAGGPSAAVKPIASEDYPTAARRPADSRLDCSKIEREHGVRLPDWRGSVEAVVKRLVTARQDQAEDDGV